MNEARYRFIDEGRQHLHTLDGKPLIGTSGVGSVLAKPLTWWASGLAVKELGIPDPKVLTKIKNKTVTPEEVETLNRELPKKLEEIKKMNPVQYLELLDSAYRAHNTTLKEAGVDGTDLHEELERYVRDQIEGITEPLKRYHPRIKPFIEWYAKNVKTPLWSEMHFYSEVHWLGGISDFGFIDNQDRLGIMDFKSSKEAYPVQFWQCAGYDIQVSENGGYTPSGLKIFDLPKPVDYYAVLPFGMENPVPSYEFDVAGAKEAFMAMLLLYKKLPRN